MRNSTIGRTLAMTSIVAGFLFATTHSFAAPDPAPPADNPIPAVPPTVARPEPSTPQDAEAKKEIDAFRERCETLIDDKNFTSRETAHYIVETDDPRLDVKQPAELLESYRTWFESYWSGRLQLRPAGEKAFIFLFYSYYKYRQLLDEGTAAGEVRPVGHYMGGVDVVAVHTDSVGAGELPNVLVHEATHQLMKTEIYGPEAEPSPWVAEGMASYFGYMRRDKSGAYLPVKIGGKDGAVFFPTGPRSSARAGEMTLDAYRSRIRKSDNGDLSEILGAVAPDQFYRGDPLEHYASAWLLVHYLLNADNAAHAAAFVTYMRHEAEGKKTPAVFYEDIGMTPAALQTAFVAYVKGL